MLLEAMLETVVHWFDKRRGTDRSTYKRLEWHANSTLQLQRLAHEEAGFGTWCHCNSDLPTTEYNQNLATLNVSNPKHPRLGPHKDATSVTIRPEEMGDTSTRNSFNLIAESVDVTVVHAGIKGVDCTTMEDQEGISPLDSTINASLNTPSSKTEFEHILHSESHSS